MNKEELVIDWDLGLKLAGNNREIAEEMIEKLKIYLTDDIQSIRKSFENNNKDELRRLIHRLHGVVSYCGTPRLKKAIVLFENILKKDFHPEAFSFLNALEREIDLLIKLEFGS